MGIYWGADTGDAVPVKHLHTDMGHVLSAWIGSDDGTAQKVYDCTGGILSAEIVADALTVYAIDADGTVGELIGKGKAVAAAHGGTVTVSNNAVSVSSAQNGYYIGVVCRVRVHFTDGCVSGIGDVATKAAADIVCNAKQEITCRSGYGYYVNNTLGCIMDGEFSNSKAQTSNIPVGESSDLRLYAGHTSGSGSITGKTTINRITVNGQIVHVDNILDALPD